MCSWKESLGFNLYQEVNFDLKCLNSIFMMISSAACRDVPRDKPVVGQDVFTHTSSIHIDGIQKDFRNYQSYPPESVGRQHTISFGKYSGRKTIMSLLESKGIKVSCENVDQVLLEIQDQIHQLKRPLRADDILGIVASA